MTQATVGVDEERWRALVSARLQALSLPFSEHWQAWRETYRRQATETAPPCWNPDEAVRATSNLARLMETAGVKDYAQLHRWSCGNRADFWAAALEALGVGYAVAPRTVLEGSAEDPAWLPGARINAAAQCFHAPPEQVAIVSRDEAGVERRITYGELQALANRVSNGLLARGLGPGDAVALYMPMTIECVAAYLGIVQAGLVVVSIPDSFAPAEVATRLRLGDARAVITVESFQRGGKEVPMAGKARKAAGRGVAVIAIGSADARADASVDASADARADASADASADGSDSWEALIDVSPEFDPVPTDPYDVTNILFSSGTTGEPKAIPWTHLTPLKAAMDGHYHQDIHPEDVVAWPTNIGWMMGPWLIYATFVNRATMMLWEGAPVGDGFLAWVRDSGTTVLGVVPALVRSWKASHETTDLLSGVRLFSSTGEASNAPDYLWLMSRTRYLAPVIEYCGGTEIGGGHVTGSVLQPQSPATFSTPAMGLDFVVLDDDGKPVSAGEHGQIFLIPPSIGLSQRLLNRDHHQEYYAGCPAGPRGQLLRRHGDEMHVLGGGYFAAGGRADDTMNLGGIKVSSVELEAVMNRHPAVVETAAIAVQPAGGGADQLVVYAVLRGGEAGDLRADLQGRIKKELNPLFRIHDVVPIESLPRTASNKVMRRELRAQYTP